MKNLDVIYWSSKGGNVTNRYIGHNRGHLQILNPH